MQRFNMKLKTHGIRIEKFINMSYTTNNTSLFCVLVILSLLSCNRSKTMTKEQIENNIFSEAEKNSEYEKKLTLEKVGTKSFRIDNSTNYVTHYLDIYKSGNDRFITYQNRDTNCIQFYSFKSEKLEKKICFPEEGSNGITKLSGFKVISLDSIFVVSSVSKAMYLVNEKGEIKNKYDLLQGDESNNTSTAMIQTKTSSLVIENDIIYLPGHPDRTPYDEGHPFVAVNLKTKDYEYVGSYTDYYRHHDDGFWNTIVLNYSHTYNNKDGFLITSFLGDPYIYKGDPRNTLKEKFLARSERFSGSLPSNQRNPNSKEFYVSTNHYGFILYDEYRNVYYRMANHALELYREDGTPNNLEDKPISIIILDESLTKVGEVFLPDNKYYFRTMFVEKEGLYISTANYSNKDLKEDYIEFDIFTTKGL